MSIASSLASIATVFDLRRSYWKAVLSTGRTLSECALRYDIRAAGLRPFDWTLDLTDTSDIMKIKELYLVCPDGKEAMLKIDEPGTAFQFKTRSMDALGGTANILEAQVIGKVTDKENGDCTCYIYDRVAGLIEYRSSIYKFGAWRENIAPIGALSHDVMGLRLS